jgi:hypothetical protein
MSKNTPFKSGDTLRSPDGLVGMLTVDKNGECEVRSIDDAEKTKWLVRSWNVQELRKAGWRKVARY